jgi:hypothetical protein
VRRRVPGQLEALQMTTSLRADDILPESLQLGYRTAEQQHPRHGLSRIRAGEQEVPEFVAGRPDADLVPRQLAEQGAEFPGGQVAVPGTEECSRRELSPCPEAPSPAPGSTETPRLSVPTTVSPHAIWAYSWIRPPGDPANRDPTARSQMAPNALTWENIEADSARSDGP